MLLQVLFLTLVSAFYCMPTGLPNLEQSCSNMTWACHDIGVAKKCNKFTNCVEIWEKIKAPQDNNEICDICKDMVKQARDQLLSNETQEEMKEVFEGSCNLLPIKAVATECIKVVDEIVPELIEMLASRMDPNMVCTVAGLCNNGKLTQMIKDQYIMSIPLLGPPTNKSEDCDNCKQGMKFVRKALQIIPKNDFTSLLLHTCVESFQGTSAQCSDLIFKLLPVYDFMLTTSEVKLCSTLGRCDTFKPNPNSKECGLCRNFVGAAQKLQKLSPVISGMKSFILDVCDQIEADEAKQKQCKTVVTQNFDAVIYLLWTKEDSSEICFRTCGKIPSLEILTGTETCDVCHEVVGALQNEARSPELKSQIVQDMNNLCKKTGEFQAVCQSFVDQYFDMIYDELVNTFLDPIYLCHALNLCPGQLLDQKKVAETHLQDVCSSVFKMYPRKSCEDFMKEVSPIIYNFLKVVNPDVFCGQMKVCPMLKPLVEGVGDNMTCEFCEALVQYVKTMVQSKTTEEEFRTAMKNFCADLKEFSDQCNALVDQYFDQAYNFIVNNLDPPTVCGALGLCNGQLLLVATKPAKAIEIQPRVNIFPDEAINTKPVKATPLTKARRPPPQSHMAGIKIQAALNTRENKYKKYLMEQNSIPQTSETNSVNEIDVQQLPVERFMPPTLVHSETVSMNCEVCKTLVSYLENEMKDPKEEAEIRKVLENACTIFPAELVNQCKDFIETNMDYLITLILQKATPEMICSFIQACPKKTEVPNFLPCELCKKVMDYLDGKLADNKTEEAVQNALDHACQELPKSWSKKCTSFVDEYTKMIIDLITHDVAPSMVCAALGLCPLESKVDGEVECTICQYVLHYVQEQLMDNATEEEIKAELEKVCTVIPRTLANDCNAFIEEFGSSMLVLLAQKLDPSIICVNFKICPGKGFYSHETLASHTIKSLKLDTCSTCQMIVDYMDKLLENDDVDTEITKLIEKICNVIPMASRDQCAAIIETYGPYVLQMIGQLSNSKEVCQAVDLCSRTPGHVQLLGGEKCTYGPSYWCQSSAHASACNAEPFCKKQVWKN